VNSEIATNKPARLLSLDVFRGLAIVGMMLVNSPGNQTAYSFLSHSAWHGCTLADFVFPFFIFIMGVSVAFAFNKARQHPWLGLLPKIIRRTIIIFLIGLFLNAFPRHFDFETLRYFGVLQRIAICYFFAAILFLGTSIRTQIILTALLLLIYWVLMVFIPVPGYGANNLTPAGNLAAYVDRIIFGPKQLYGKVFDPEGVLSTIPSIATALTGNITGVWLLSRYTRNQKCLGRLIAGVISAILGWIWGLSFPINKSLWTSSYVLWTTGFALIILAIFYWLTDIKGWRAWAKPLEIFGVNALAAYFLHIFFLKIQAMIHIKRLDGSTVNLRIYITEHLFGWVPSLKLASLFYAITYIVFWLLILWILYRKKIFIKI